MTGLPVDFGAVDDLVAALRAGGVRADTDPSALTPPCIWVNVAGVTWDYLAAYTINTTLVCITNDQDHRRAMTDLAALVNVVSATVDPTGPATAQGTILPDAPSSPLPSLSVPYDLLVN